MTDLAEVSSATMAPTYQELLKEVAIARREKRLLWILIGAFAIMLIALWYSISLNWRLDNEVNVAVAKNKDLSAALLVKNNAEAKGPVGIENMEALKKEANDLIEKPDPRYPSSGYSLRAYAHACTRDFDAAKADLAEARRIDPKRYHYPYYYGKALFALLHFELHDDVTEQIETMLRDSEPNDTRALKVAASYFGFTKDEKTRDIKRALLLMERLIDARSNVCPRDEFILYAHLLATDGRHREALSVFRRAMLVRTESPQQDEREDAVIKKIIEQLEKGTYTPPPMNSPLQVL